MLVAPDANRKFPLQSIPYLDTTVDDLFEQLLALKRGNCPDWTDESTSDFGIQLLWLQAVLGGWLADYMDRVKANAYLATATSREAVRKLCELIGYTLSEASAASVTVTFTCASGHPQFSIPARTRVGTKSKDGREQVIFETISETNVNVGVDSVDVLCNHGESIVGEILGSSDASSDQSFTLKRTGVVWHSEVIEVNDGTGWVTWTRVDNFVLSGGSDTHYRVQLSDDGKYLIIFSDGIHGKVPTRGLNNIRSGYRIGGGVVGNVGAGQIVEPVSSLTYVTGVTNALAASGGTESESLEHARLFAPAWARALDRCVTAGDIEALAMLYDSPNFGRIAQARVVEHGGVVFSVMIVPRSGTLPSAIHKSELQTYLAERKMANTAIEVIDPVYRAIDIAVTVTGFPNYAPSELCTRIRERLVAYLSPVYQDPESGIYPHGFGRDIYVSDLYAIIDGTDGVHHCSLVTPTSDIILNDFEIADIGSIALTIELPEGEFSYYSDREGIDSEFRDRLINPKRPQKATL
jgi:hypothetical protein